jgi:hypothetical protein
MTFHSCELTGDDNPEGNKQAMLDMLGPQAVDGAIRQAISTCWMMMPDDKKNVAAVEAEIRRLVDRALANLQEDAKAFGIETDG